MLNHQDHLLIVIYHHTWLLITIIMFLMDYHYDWFSLYIYISHQIPPPMDHHGPHGQNPKTHAEWPLTSTTSTMGLKLCSLMTLGAWQISSPLIKNGIVFSGKKYETTKIGLKPSKNMSLLTNGLILPDARNKNEDLIGGRLVGTECPKHANMLMAEKAGPGPKNGKLFCLKTQRNVGATGKAENQIIYCSCHLNLESCFQVIPHCRTGSNSRFQ